MGEVIVITSGKGGVGKTTATANVGAGLALMGKKVVLVDADIGLRNLDVVLGLENRIVYHIVDVIEEVCTLKKALVRSKLFEERLCLLPAAQTRDKSAVTPEQMQEIVKQLSNEFDYVLIDCPAGIEGGFKNAIAGASKALIVVNPEMSSVRDADRVIGLLDAEGIHNPLLIVNRIRPHMVKKGDMLDIQDIIEVLAINIIGIVPEDEYVIVATNKGEPAVINKDALVGKAYQNIVRRLMGEEVPFLDIYKDKGFFDKIRRKLGL